MGIIIVHQRKGKAMDDLISNRAAVDALERIFDRCEEIEAHFPDGDPDKTGYKMFPDYITVWKYLHQLSSVERFSQKEKLKMRVASEDLFPDLPQIIKDKNTEIAKAYQKGYEQGKKDAEQQGRWEVCNILDYAQRPSGRKILRCSLCGYLTNDFRSMVDYSHELTNYCPMCGARMDRHFEEPEINPCRGCGDYDSKGGCISNGGCGAKIEEDR